jgi:hypothetical protein
MREYRPLYSDLAAEFILSLPKRRQRKLLDACNQLSKNPFFPSDYTVSDSDGRPIEHIAVEGFLISYWVDHAVGKVMVIEVDDLR